MLSKLVAAVRRIERFLRPEDDWVPKVRQIAYRAAQRVLTPLTNYSFTREKGRADFIGVTRAEPDEIETALWEAGYQRNVLSTWKYRTTDGERENIVSAWVYDPPETDWQHDVYLFDNGGTTDIYGHREPSVRDIDDHLDLSTGTHGDPNNRVADALANKLISFENTTDTTNYTA